MLTRKVSKVIKQNLLLTRTSLDVAYPIIKIFNQFPSKMNLELKKNIILNAIEDAIHHIEAPCQLTLKDAHIPQHLPLEQQLEIACDFRKKYYASPVLTSHPTEVLSEDALQTIQRIVKNVFSNSKQSKNQLIKDVTWIIEHSLLPKSDLTPQEEMDRQNTLYLDMMASWSSFNRHNIDAFAQHHHHKKNKIIETLTPFNKYAYNHVSSWAIADVDGNQKRSRQTMERMELSLQLAIATRYRFYLKNLLHNYPALKSSDAYLKRCQQAIQNGILFDLKASEVAKKRFCQKLQKIIQTPYLPPEHKQKLIELQDLVDLVGFRGELRQFVRQSSHSNQEVLNELGQILKKEHKVFQMLLENQTYADLNPENKTLFHHYLRSDSKFFKTIKNERHRLSYHCLRELEILDFVTHYQDQFSYILSDTQNSQSLDEVVLLFALASFIHGHLSIDDIRKPPILLIPLCETPKDLAHLPEILEKMLKSPYLKEVILQKGELIYVAGPSDLGKEGGLFAQIQLIEAEKKAQDVLKACQESDTSLKSIQLRVLYGLGGDFHRRISQSAYQLFATFQGSDACRLGNYHAYQAFVEQVTGQASENTFRALELRILEFTSPHDYQYLQHLIHRCIQAYERYTKHPAAQHLFKALSIPHALGVLTNKSSRNESKSIEPKDILKSRAIGITNYDISTLFMTRVFMSADGLTDEAFIPNESLISIYQHATVVQEMIQKILFAIAISDENRAWLLLLGYIPNEKTLLRWAKQFKEEGHTKAHFALAYCTIQLPKIIRQLSYFLPYPEVIQNFWKNQSPKASRQLALELIQHVGREDTHFATLAKEIESDLLPRYQRLAQCIDSYRLEYKNATPKIQKELEENCILALRGDRKITSGPKTISNLHHRFHHLMNPSMSKRFHKTTR